MTPEEIAESCLICVYHDVTAVVSLDGNGGLLGLRLFDTRFGAEHLAVHPKAREVWLITRHADGWHGLYEEDRASIARVQSAVPQARLLVLIADEDTGCTQVGPEDWR